MNLNSILFDKFETIAIEDFLSSSDPLSDRRKDFKFITPLDSLPQIFDYLQESYICAVEGSSAIRNYRNKYFDTSDYKFYQMHRKGKYNRLKVRLRQYGESGDIFVESKLKENGERTKKQRVKADFIDSRVLEQDFIPSRLQDFDLSTSDLSNETHISYDRIFLVSKNRGSRITIDFNILASGEDLNYVKQVAPEYAILEVKQGGYPKDIIRFLKNNFKIRESRFSKYCVSLCLLEDGLKKNVWKQTLKKYCEQTV